MHKILRSKTYQLLAILVLCGVCGCIYKEGAVYVGDANQPLCHPFSEKLVSPQQLADSDLEIVWQSELPIIAGEKLVELTVLGGRIYALSSGNFLVAVNREKGTALFSRHLAESGFPVLGLGSYQNELFTIAGNNLVEMDPDYGADVNVVDLKVNATCSAVRNRSFFYIAGTDRRVHALRAADKIRIFEVSADDGSAVTSVVANEDFVVFATDTGTCAAFVPDGPKKLWQFNAADGVVEPVVQNPDKSALFFASKDTNVYRLNMPNGEFVWKCQIGAIPHMGPRVTRNCVYQYTGDNGLMAIDSQSGRILWQLPEGVDLLAEGGDKAYVLTIAGEITAMDNVKSRKLYSISIPAVSRYAVNVSDSKIYIADYAGRIACLKPIK